MVRDSASMRFPLCLGCCESSHSLTSHSRGMLGQRTNSHNAAGAVNPGHSQLGSRRCQPQHPHWMSLLLTTCAAVVMLRSKRPRYTVKRDIQALKASAAGKWERRLDVWLPRFSHFAQFGLFLITVWGLYFTVIPLYQKALLDEAIAKKEIELAVTSKSADKLYAKVRKYVSRDFYIQAMPACGSLYPQWEVRKKNEKNQEIAPSDPIVIYDIDMPACFNKLLRETRSLKELRDSDLQVFEKAVADMALALLDKRRISMEMYEAAPSKITKNDLFSLPPDSFQTRAQEVIERWNGGAIDLVGRRKIAISVARQKIVSEYGQAIADGVLGLSNVKWAVQIDESK